MVADRLMMIEQQAMMATSAGSTFIGRVTQSSAFRIPPSKLGLLTSNLILYKFNT